MKYVVAFVDDEQNILRGLKRLLRSKRDVWDMAFLEGGKAAIDWVSHNEPDAIVTDMRMPNVDGAKVLEFAASHKKGRIRIVLSGEADRDLTRRTVGRSHQFFSKPCDEGKLIRAIEAAFAFDDEILPRSMQKYMSNITCFAGSTQTHDVLEGVFKTGNLSELTQVVAHDPGLAFRVLQLANSSYFGSPAETLSIASAVNNVGLETLADLWETGALLAAADTAPIDAELTNISTEAVKTAQRLFERSQQEGASDADCEDGYAIGLLSWIGEVIGCTGSEMLKQTLQDKGAVAAAAYVTCLSGMPLRVSQIMEHLVSVSGAGGSAQQRADEISAVRFHREKAL
ncbi:response regulator [Hirschia litorea]|uniref:Response regulator n=1 Tax=Hirschia litorea TaxID=1199156 RepID=A0ABW2IIE0_9PROT